MREPSGAGWFFRYFPVRRPLAPSSSGKIGPDRPAAALALVCGERIELDTVAVRPLLTEIRAWGRWDQALVVGVGEYAEPNPDDECLRHSGHW